MNSIEMNTGKYLFVFRTIIRYLYFCYRSGIWVLKLWITIVSDNKLRKIIL